MGRSFETSQTLVNRAGCASSARSLPETHNEPLTRTGWRAVVPPSFGSRYLFHRRNRFHDEPPQKSKAGFRRLLVNSL